MVIFTLLLFTIRFFISLNKHYRALVMHKVLTRALFTDINKFYSLFLQIISSSP